jgi:hypothetical protein
MKQAQIISEGHLKVAAANVEGSGKFLLRFQLDTGSNRRLDTQ